MTTTRKLIKNALQQALAQNGYNIIFEGIGDSYLIQNNADSKTCLIQLAISSTVCVNRQCSEENEIYGMGFFKLKIPVGKEYPNFYILAQENAITGQAEFMIMPSTTLSEHLFNMGQAWKSKVELCFLSYPDGKIFEISNLSGESRWYLLRQGTGGRMIDGTFRDYSRFLNNWDTLII